MPQKTDDIGTSHVNNSIINGKTILNGTMDSPEPIENRQQQSKTITDSTISRRLSTTIDRTAGMVARSNPRQTKNATNLKVDDPVGNFRLSIDDSVVSALLDCAYADVKHEVLGYLGGTCDVDQSDNTIVCHVGQFVASERIVTSLLTDEVQEMPNSRDNAIKFFEENNLEFVGWYRSNFQSNLNSIPTQSDILKQTSIQSKFPNSAGIIVNISATSCPSIGSKGTNVTGLVNSISIFRTFESPNTNGDINNSVQNNKKNGKIWKGKGKANLKANKVSFTVNRQMYMCPNVMQQLSCALMTVLRETRQTYAGQVLECENRNGQRIFVDSQYESFLMSFLRKSTLQFDRSIDQDFRTLSLAKLHVKSLISKRINDTLTISQNDKDNSEKLSNRRKLDKLIEKLVTQRMDKREKEMENLKNGEKDAVLLLNSKSQNDEQTINEPTVKSLSSESLSKEAAGTVEFSIPEHFNQNISRKGSSSLSQLNNTNIDVVVIDSDSNSEIDIEADDIPSKPLLRKPSLDSSQLNPLVTQRMDKREKEMENLKNGEKDAVLLLNSKSQNDEQTINEPTVKSLSSESLSKEAAGTVEFSIPEHFNQNISRKGSSSLSQLNNTNIDVVVIDSDSNSEIDIEADDIPSKPLLRKPSLDSSQLNPVSKRLKTSISKFSSNHVQMNGNSSSIQSNKSPHLPSSFLSESSTFSPLPLVPNSSSTIHITVPSNSSTGTPNGSQYSQISQVNYQYPKYVTNGFRPFHNGPEDLNLRSPTASNDNKIVNVSQSSGIHLPSIQGLLEISNRASMQPPTSNSMPNVVVVDPNSTIVQHSSFPTPLLPSFQNNHYYSYNQQQAISRTTSPPDSSPIQHHLHTINNTSTGSTSTNSRHYVPIAPSPIATTTGGNRPPPPPPILQATTSASSSIYTNNTTNHFGTESDYQWKL
ncbi:hypothetical protein RclHR1_03940007 [Rhizophagus clarus]|uniref:MPN domain-containing protein n=1 Tax=Rhizophagus clarus TaxID=94130 RepID=A0A2Z6RFI0_9GLOM|nr:hypothetical protein RclHR1_03940007 [Rhizophagus clarus]